jgi:hypothetical protein
LKNCSGSIAESCHKGLLRRLASNPWSSSLILEIPLGVQLPDPLVEMGNDRDFGLLLNFVVFAEDIANYHQKGPSSELVWEN